MSKCLWLICKRTQLLPVEAEYSCSENLGTLASLDEPSVTRIGEYLNYIKARNLGINQVSYLIYKTLNSIHSKKIFPITLIPNHLVN